MSTITAQTFFKKQQALQAIELKLRNISFDGSSIEKPVDDLIVIGIRLSSFICDVGNKIASKREAGTCICRCQYK
jgi:hypothetical protein